MSMRPFRNQILRARAGGSSRGLHEARTARRDRAQTRSVAPAPPRAAFAGPGAAHAQAPTSLALPVSRIAAARTRLARLGETVRSTLRGLLRRRAA